MDSLYRTPSGEKAIQDFYSRILAKWTWPHQERYINTRFGRTFIIESGPASAPVLILQHDAGSNSLSWSGDIPLFARHFRVIALDIPGDPGRSAPNRLSWQDNSYAEWLDEALTSLSLTRVSLLGLSQEGRNALKYATYRHQKVEKLVLLSPAGVTRDRSSFLIKAIWFSLLGMRGRRSLIKMTFGKIPADPEAVAFMELIFTHYRSRFDSLQLFKATDLKKLIMPVLLVGGKLDAIRDVTAIELRLNQHLPQLKSRIYPDRGHVLVNIAGDILPFLAH